VLNPGQKWLLARADIPPISDGRSVCEIDLQLRVIRFPQAHFSIPARGTNDYLQIAHDPRLVLNCWGKRTRQI
jgi:hypothetical protein